MSPRPETPLVIAHRGASAYQPENTLRAYSLAVEQAADMIEIDLHLSRDGEIVVSHDAKLERFGAEGMIGERTLAELRELDAGRGWDAPAQIPTLTEVLDQFGASISFNLELKWDDHAGDYPGLEARTLAEVERRGLLASTLFSSFRDSILVELRRLSPDARLAALAEPRSPGKLVERAQTVGAEAVNPHFVMILADPELVPSAHAAGLAVYSYTVNDSERMQELLRLGADGLFTNHPDVMRSLLRG
jgi:glycerophosphoryl diester phosphodiesterase